MRFHSQWRQALGDVIALAADFQPRTIVPIARRFANLQSAWQSTDGDVVVETAIDALDEPLQEVAQALLWLNTTSDRQRFDDSARARADVRFLAAISALRKSVAA